MEFQRVTPESLVSESVEPKSLSPLLHGLTGILLNGAIKTGIGSIRAGPLAPHQEWKCADTNGCCNEKYPRNASQMLHEFLPPQTLSGDCEFRYAARRE